MNSVYSFYHLFLVKLQLFFMYWIAFYRFYSYKLGLRDRNCPKISRIISSNVNPDKKMLLLNW